MEQNAIPKNLSAIEKRGPGLLLLVLFCIIMFLLTFMYVKVREINNTYPPRNTLMSRVMVDVTESHLWFEEILSGDQNEHVEIVLTKLEDSKKRMAELLEGSETIIKLTDTEQIAAAREAQRILDDFYQVTLTRLNKQETSAAGSDIDQAYDEIFKSFMVKAKSLSDNFLVDTKDEFAYFSNLQQFSIGMEILSFSIASLIMWHIGRRRDDVYQRVIQLNDELDDKVKLRTEELETSLEKMERTQKHMIEQEKMAALGGMVAGVAHEVNTPLGVSYTASTLFVEKAQELQDKFEKGEMKKSELNRFLTESSELASAISHNMERCSHLISSFKEITVDQSHYSAKYINAKTYVEEVLVTLNSMLKRTSHNIYFQCDENLEIYTYPGILAQILTNFIQNSLIHGFEEKDAGSIEIDISRSGEKNIVLRYKDDGKGADEETLNRMFEPFYTSKRASGGSGLGLSVVYNLVNHLEGDLSCTSEPGNGLEYVFTFQELPKPH